MFTFKQLEALYWIAELGGFAAAARRLNASQSAISKRIFELESSLGEPLFERDRRQARLSDRGEEVLLVASRLLEQRDAAIEQLGKAGVVARRVRIGVTELTAITWLPRLVQSIREAYPNVVIEPEVAASVDLRDKMLAGETDLIIVPDVFAEERFECERLGNVQLAWMCKPGLLPTSRPVRADELANATILTQGRRSGTAILFEPWFRSQNLVQAKTISSSSMLALIGLTVAGVGVSYLPRACLGSLLDQHALAVLRTSPSLPRINYVVLLRRGRRSALIAAIVAMAKSTCDFSSLF